MNDAPGKHNALLDGPVIGQEPMFLEKLPNDNLVGAIMALTAEIYLLRERLQTLEGELETRKVLPTGAIENHEPNELERAARATDLADFTARVLTELARDRTPVSTIDPRVTDMMKTYAELKRDGRV